MCLLSKTLSQGAGSALRIELHGEKQGTVDLVLSKQDKDLQAKRPSSALQPSLGGHIFQDHSSLFMKTQALCPTDLSQWHTLLIESVPCISQGIYSLQASNIGRLCGKRQSVRSYRVLVAPNARDSIVQYSLGVLPIVNSPSVDM